MAAIAWQKSGCTCSLWSPDWLKNRSILDMKDEDFCRNPYHERILIVEVCKPVARFSVTFLSVRVIFLSHTLRS